jgi:hypothetical protein
MGRRGDVTARNRSKAQSGGGRRVGGGVGVESEPPDEDGIIAGAGRTTPAWIGAGLREPPTCSTSISASRSLLRPGRPAQRVAVQGPSRRRLLSRGRHVDHLVAEVHVSGSDLRSPAPSCHRAPARCHERGNDRFGGACSGPRRGPGPCARHACPLSPQRPPCQVRLRAPARGGEPTHGSRCCCRIPAVRDF